MKKVTVLLASLFVVPLAFSSEILNVAETQLVGPGVYNCPEGYELKIDADSSENPSPGDTCVKTTLTVKDGRVGIGTKNPFMSLEVRGTASETLGAPNVVLSARNPDSYTTIGFGNVEKLYPNPPSEIGFLETDVSGGTKGDLIFATRDSTVIELTPLVRMTIKADGDVGIGTPAPGAKLDVAGDINASGKIKENGFSLIPRGMVSAFNGSTCPAGWDLADGTNDPAVGGGSNPADLRGQFVRGIDSGAGNDPEGERIPGQAQEDAFKKHSHPTRLAIGYSLHQQWGAGGGVGNPQSIHDPEQSGHTYTPSGLTGGDETRPKNVALLYCIKE